MPHAGIMMQPLVLGIDCGTQSLRAAMYQPDGLLVAQAIRGYTTQYPHPGHAEQRPADWWDALCGAVRGCLRDGGIPPETVAALACDGTSYTGVFCTDGGHPLRPALLWMDHRAAAEAQYIEETGHPALDTCGRRISPEWTLPKVLWAQIHEPETYAAAERIVEGADWLIHRMTGRWVTSNSNASGKRHWTPKKGWPVAFYESLGLPELAIKSPSEVVYLGEPVGRLTPAAADALGLTPQCIVAHGGMDGWTAAVGKNCFHPGTASLALGTSIVMAVEHNKPLIINGVMGPFPDGIRRGYWAYEAGQTSGASVVGWLVKTLGFNDDAETHHRLGQDAAAIAPGSEGLTVFDAWRGSRTPYFDFNARGVFCGLTLEHSPAHLYRAVLEGCAFGIRNVLTTYLDGGLPIESLRVCGSGAENLLWTRIIASVTGIPLMVSHEKHATCLGSAVCAAVAAGLHPNLTDAAAAMEPLFDTVEPNPEAAKVYDAGFERYRAIYTALKPVMHQQTSG